MMPTISWKGAFFFYPGIACSKGKKNVGMYKKCKFGSIFECFEGPHDLLDTLTPRVVSTLQIIIVFPEFLNCSRSKQKPIRTMIKQFNCHFAKYCDCKKKIKHTYDQSKRSRPTTDRIRCYGSIA